MIEGMRNMKNLKTEQRNASNKRILECALLEFAENGFSRTLLSNVAHRAGYSNGMITQRFGGKENLYNEVFINVCRNYLNNFSENESADKMLLRIVDDIKQGAQNRIPEFVFVADYLSSRDSPVNGFDIIKPYLEESAFTDVIKKAISESGTNNEEDPFDMIRIFIISSINLAKSFVKADLELPPSESFLTLLRPTKRRTEIDLLNARLADQLTGQISSEFDGVFLVNLDLQRTVVARIGGIYNSANNDRLRDHSTSFDERTRRFADDFIAEEDRQRYIDFMNRERLLRLFGKEKRISIRYRVCNPTIMEYQTVIRFGEVNDTGHWITVGIKNAENESRELITDNLLKERFENSRDINRLTDVYELIAKYDASEDTLNIYRAEGVYADVVPDSINSRSGLQNLLTILKQTVDGSDRDEVLTKIKDYLSEGRDMFSDGLSLRFRCTYQMRQFRTLLKIYPSYRKHDQLVIGILDLSKL